MFFGGWFCMGGGKGGFADRVLVHLLGTGLEAALGLIRHL